MYGERISSTNSKSTDESVKYKGDVGCVCDWKGIVHHEFVRRGQMVNKQLHKDVVVSLRDAIRRETPELWENHTWMLYHDNAPFHTSFLIRSCLAKHETPAVHIHTIVRT